MSGLLIFMVKDFTTSQFTGFNYRKNTINKRSHSLMPLWQGKLEVVKQEMARVNVNILGISELK